MKPLTAKIAYKPVGLALSLVAGALASVVSRRLWRLFSNEDSLPDADDVDVDWFELLSGAALEAAVFAVAKATAARLESAGIRRAIRNEEEQGEPT
ncbi:MAG: hypothetical protein AUG49_14455 [Catenulispora sp. 13_1_20CM_3_70_7]|jgi:hypothetical protein|nr:MAG: hypothetical protein AUG49_14455 [Catenulispora sp. 13_1_20CM_3_70_7]